MFRTAKRCPNTVSKQTTMVWCFGLPFKVGIVYASALVVIFSGVTITMLL